MDSNSCDLSQKYEDMTSKTRRSLRPAKGKLYKNLDRMIIDEDEEFRLASHHG